MADNLNKYFGVLQKIFEDVFELKKNGKEFSNELLEKRKQGALQFVVIKKLNRQAKYDLRAGREKLHSEKLLVDSNRLQLQNLLYEVSHLKREIKRCHKFKSQDEDIELLSEEEYCRQLKPAKLPQSKHAKRLARLDWELTLRKQLSEKCKSLLDSKKAVCQEIVSSTERLASFAPSLRQLLKATQPLQDALQLPLEREWKLKQIVHLLPHPLYLAYMNIHALEKSFDKDVLSCTVVGATEEEVQQTDIEMQLAELEQRSSVDLDEVEGTAKKRRVDQTHLKEMLFKRALEPHPLIVRFAFTNPTQAKEFLVVQLRYFPHVKILTAATEVSLAEPDTSAADLTIVQNILSILYKNDTGNVLPIAATDNRLKKYNTDAKEYLESLLSNKFGRPYCWLQRMCGLEAYSEFEVDKCDITIAGLTERIYHLWQSRLNLMRQIKVLMTKNLDVYLKQEKFTQVRPAGTLVQWTSVAWEEYAQNVTTQKYINNNLAQSSHLFYRAVIVRGSAKMECLINVPALYAEDNPLWAICIHWNGEHNACNNTAIQMLEAHINELEQSDLKTDTSLLAAQLLRTMYGFDIYLETECLHHDPPEFAKEKHFNRPFNMRMRVRPLKYLENNCEFTQF